MIKFLNNLKFGAKTDKFEFNRRHYSFLLSVTFSKLPCAEDLEDFNGHLDYALANRVMDLVQMPLD